MYVEIVDLTLKLGTIHCTLKNWENRRIVVTADLKYVMGVIRERGYTLENAQEVLERIAGMKLKDLDLYNAAKALDTAHRIGKLKDELQAWAHFRVMLAKEEGK